MNTIEKTSLTGKNFILVVIGQIISLFGNAIIRFALPLYVLDYSGSSTLFGMVTAFSFIPMIIMSPIGGIIADRVNKQKVMVILDFITALLIFSFIVLSGKSSMVTLVLIVMMALYAIQGVYSPSVQASIPLLIKEDKIMSANAIINLVNSFSGLIGPVTGGMLYGIYGLQPIVIVGCVCFLISAIMELFIKIPHTKRESSESILTIVKNDTADSVRYMTKEKPILLKIIIIVSLFNMVFSSLMIIGLPVIITQTLNISSKLYGAAQAMMAAGGIVGGVIAGVFAKKIRIENSYTLLIICAITLIPGGVTLFLNLPAIVSYLIFASIGFFAMIFATVFTVQMLSYVQIETPTEIVGKVLSTLMAISMCSQPIGQSIYGILFEKTKASGNQWIIIIAASLISFLIALFSKATFETFKNNKLAEKPA